MRPKPPASVYGGRTFDVARGWGGNHPTGVPVIVVTHGVPDAAAGLDLAKSGEH